MNEEQLRLTIDTMAQQVTLWQNRFSQLEAAAKQQIEGLQKKLSEAEEQIVKLRAESPEHKQAGEIVAKAGKATKGANANDTKHGTRAN